MFLQGLWSSLIDNGKKGNITLDINMRGTGLIFWNEANSLRQPFYALLGAGVTYGYENFTVELWGRNLTSTRYHTFYFMSMGNEFLQRGRRAEAGVTVRFNI